MSKTTPLPDGLADLLFLPQTMRYKPVVPADANIDRIVRLCRIQEIEGVILGVNEAGCAIALLVMRNFTIVADNIECVAETPGLAKASATDLTIKLCIRLLEEIPGISRTKNLLYLTSFAPDTRQIEPQAAYTLMVTRGIEDIDKTPVSYALDAMSPRQPMQLNELLTTD